MYFSLFIILLVRLNLLAYSREIDENDIFFSSPHPLISTEDITQIKPNSVGIEILFSDSGLGLGCQFEHFFSLNYRLNYGIAFSGKRNTDEIEFWDYIKNDYSVPDKINRLFTIPINIGLQYQIIFEDLAKSFRPFVGLSAIPMLIWQMPYKADFFSEIKDSRIHFRAGLGAAIGADFGAFNTTLLSFKIKYNYVPWGANGIESVKDMPIKNMGGVFLSLTAGGFF